MSDIEQATGSAYMHWAKTQSRARFNLATSGIAAFPFAKLGVTLKDLEITGPSWYGYEPLQQALAAKCGVASECIVAAIGTSLANHLAMAAVVEPGCEVLIERPAYEPLVSLARYLGCKVRRFDRGFERGFQIEAEEVRRNVTRGTRLIVITNLHNPSGVLTGETTLRQIGEIARNAGARVLVDEVYLEMLHVEGSSQRPPHAFGLGSEFITTSSLTKAYGLSGLRCGWVLAEPDLATRMWRINDLFGAVPAHPAELLSVIALERLDQIAARARSLLRANRAMLNGFLDSRPDLQTIRPRFGTIVFPRLTKGTVEVFCALLRSRYETTVVPGSFFEAPEHFRLGVGGDFGELAGGLDRLGATLDEI